MSGVQDSKDSSCIPGHYSVMHDLIVFGFNEKELNLVVILLCVGVCNVCVCM